MEGNTQQLELFSGPGASAQTSGLSRNTLLGHIRGYEKIILVTIGFIVSAVISFSLGVEKGKLIALAPPASKSDITAAVIRPDTQKIETVNALPAPAGSANTSIVQAKAASPVQGIAKLQNYTIQLASYQSKNLAQKEAGALKKKGLAPLVLSKGSYSILCVGSFNSKETAKPLLSQLKKKYQDSFIRRL
jgi:hypothetical protein